MWTSLLCGFNCVKGQSCDFYVSCNSNSHGHIMTGTLHCYLGESYLHRGDSLSLDVQPANPQGHSVLSSIRNHI